MIDLSQNSASVCKEVPTDKFFTNSFAKQYNIASVKWLMSIKPEIRNVKSFVKERIRMEEIEVFSVQIPHFPDYGSDKKLMAEICKRIAYPCVVFIDCGEKYKIAAWKFVDPVKMGGNNLLKEYYSTAWIHEPSYSFKANDCVEKIFKLLFYGEGCIKELYNEICKTLFAFSPNYIGSRHHLGLILYDLTGDKHHKVEAKIDCFKRYVVVNQHKKYQPKEYGTNYQYMYEYEDIWFALMNDEEIRQTIQNRRYQDIEDLIHSIDQKYEDVVENPHPNGWMWFNKIND